MTAQQEVGASPFFTVGHSNRSLEDFLALLRAAGVALVADVRRLPGSRRQPQFDAEALAAALAEEGIGFQHLPELGGRRSRDRDVPETVNGYWQVRGFHNYADYALGETFQAGLQRLLALGRRTPCAVMCAEAVWWRCHRRIVSDYLIARGERVCHILAADDIRPARLTEAARRRPDGRLVYPAA